jgi:YggT family protein
VLGSLLLLVLEAVLGFFSLLLIGRFYMQWARVSFRNQLGQFVTALTDWLVLPARRFIPALFGLDLASLLPAWLAQSVLVSAEFWLRGFSFGSSAGLAAVLLLALGLIETVRVFTFLMIGIVLIAAVMSWVNPYSPFAPLFNAMARPFLRPLQRVIPPVANIDLSPLVLLLLFQIVLMLLATLRGGIVPMIT